METIKQPDDWSCGICCIQMLTGYSRKEILEFLEIKDSQTKEMGISFWQVILILYTKGIAPGLILGEKREIIPISDDIDDLVIENFREMLLLVTVESDVDGNYEHSVLWDGKKFRDPNPTVADHAHWEGYNILEITPLMFQTDEIKHETYKRLHD